MYPVEPDRGTRGSVLATTGVGFAVGTVIGVIRDAAVGVTAMSISTNFTITGLFFFSARDLLISPLLLTLHPTTDHLRRLQKTLDHAKNPPPPPPVNPNLIYPMLYNNSLAEQAKPRVLNPREEAILGRELGPETWWEWRGRRVLDSSLAGGIASLGAAYSYRSIMHTAGFPPPPPLTRRAAARSTLMYSLAFGLGQFLVNEARIVNHKFTAAYDSTGPIEGVDIARVRLEQREGLVELGRGLLDEEDRQKKADAAEAAAVAAGGGAGRRHTGHEESLTSQFLTSTSRIVPGSLSAKYYTYFPTSPELQSWYDPRRFGREWMPKVYFIPHEVKLARLEGERDQHLRELREIEEELIGLGEVPFEGLRPEDMV